MELLEWDGAEPSKERSDNIERSKNRKAHIRRKLDERGDTHGRRGKKQRTCR